MDAERLWIKLIQGCTLAAERVTQNIDGLADIVEKTEGLAGQLVKDTAACNQKIATIMAEKVGAVAFEAIHVELPVLLITLENFEIKIWIDQRADCADDVALRVEIKSGF